MRKGLGQSGPKERPNIKVLDAVAAIYVVLRRSLAQRNHNEAINI